MLFCSTGLAGLGWAELGWLIGLDWFGLVLTELSFFLGGGGGLTRSLTLWEGA